VGLLNAADDVGRAEANPGVGGLEKFGQGLEGFLAHCHERLHLAEAAHVVELIRVCSREVFDVRAGDCGEPDPFGGGFPGKARGDGLGGEAQ